MTTRRLYYEDAYVRAFDARIEAVEGKKIYLDESAFYPTSGGQPHDTGALGVARVVDVVDEGDRVAHVMASVAALDVGTRVHGEVDWTRRFDFMQQHTGQHLLSAVLDDVLRLPTVSVHFGDDAATLDVEGSVPGIDRVREIERRANAIVLEHRPVRVTFEHAAAAQGLRKPSDRGGMLRIVAIEGVDRSACGGTHVHTTGEIGPVLLRRVEKYKQGARIEFLCGQRALARARTDHELLVRAASALSCGVDDLAAQAESVRDKLRDLEGERRRLVEANAEMRAAALHAASMPDKHGFRRIHERVTTGDELRQLAQALSRLPGVVFAGTVADPPTVSFATAEGTEINAGARLKAALATHGGRGGGGPRVAQGTLSSSAALDALVRDLLAPG